MGALPKNKITIVERGKRRRGNTPTVTSDPNLASVPLHKRGLVAQMMNRLGISDSPVVKHGVDKKQDNPGKRKKKPVSQQQITRDQEPKNIRETEVPHATGTRKTQHKG